jgi:hypothetical protein
VKTQSFGISASLIPHLVSLKVELVCLRYVGSGSHVTWHITTLQDYVDGFDHMDEQTGEPQKHVKAHRMTQISCNTTKPAEMMADEL